MPLGQDEPAFNPKSRFIAVNILPPPQIEGVVDATLALQECIAKAESMGFTHAWLNPISRVAPESICYRTDLDTGVATALYSSLYAPDNPLKHNRPDLSVARMREINNAANMRGFSVLADFVWKHVSENASLLAKRPEWFSGGKKIKDIIEYEFTDEKAQLTETGQEVIAYMHRVIKLLLDPKDGYGFAGLRIDAASHLTPDVREALYGYVRKHYPEAIIFEEVLFDRAQETGIVNLVSSAEKSGIFSDFVTSNLYYQSPDSFGALPSPHNMGDTVKLRLARSHGISFTGNHDHFSIGWCTVLSMAFEVLKYNHEFLERIQGMKATPSGSKSDHAQAALEELLSISEDMKHASLAENLDAGSQGVIRYLLPYANKIARSLLDKSDPDHQKLFEEFQSRLLEKMYNRTLASISGYFFIFSELVSPFYTQRIFSNQQGNPLPQLLLTVNDLMSNMVLTNHILLNMAGVYSNLTNFLKALPILKKARVPGYNLKKGEDILLEQELTFCLPYIIDYLRNNPSENKYNFYKNPQAISDSEQILMQDLGLESLIEGINTIYKGLTTPGCSQYHTFNSLDQFKIIVRCSEESTDVIVLNLNPDKKLTLADMDLEKIALWFQSRLYPQDTACASSVPLSSPFTDDPTTHPPHGYMDYWLRKVGHIFNSSYNRIIGAEAGHPTNLYVGANITIELERYKPTIRIQLKTKIQEEYEVFEGKAAATLAEKPRIASVGAMKHTAIFATAATDLPAAPTRANGYNVHS